MQIQQFREKSMRIVFAVCAAVSIAAVALICFFLIAYGLFSDDAHFLKHIASFVSGKSWKPVATPAQFGILPMIVGSLYITAGAIVIGVPIGIFAAVFMARVCPKRLYRIIKPGVDLLAGIPSVVYGFFGMTLIVPLCGNSMLSASILLGIMILPTIIGLSETAIRAVPESYYEGAVALGAGHFRAVFKVTLPAAKSGVLASAVLGVGRAIGETMAVVMVAGNQARMPALFNYAKGARTLTANIVIEMGYAAELHRTALIATGVVLLVFILLINLSFQAITKGNDKL